MKCRNENCNAEIPENAEICQTCRTTGYLTQICPTCNIILDVTQSSCPYCDQVQTKYLTPKDEGLLQLFLLNKTHCPVLFHGINE